MAFASDNDLGLRIYLVDPDSYEPVKQYPYTSAGASRASKVAAKEGLFFVFAIDEVSARKSAKSVGRKVLMEITQDVIKRHSSKKTRRTSKNARRRRTSKKPRRRTSRR